MFNAGRITDWMQAERRKLADWADAASKAINEAEGLDEVAKAAKQAELDREIRQRLEELARKKDEMWGEIWETLEELIERLSKADKETGFSELRPGNRTSRVKVPDNSEWSTWSSVDVCVCRPVTPG